MKYPKELNEALIQVKILEFLHSKFEDALHFSALEARYSQNDRRADVLAVLTDRSTHAFEIKSDLDNLDKLPDQLKDYRQTFDYITVVTTPRHVKKIKEILGKNDGLIVISNREQCEVKPPKLYKRTLKRNLISMCSKLAFVKELDSIGPHHSIDIIYDLAEKKLSLSELKRITHAELMRRFEKKYNTFLQDARLPYGENDLFELKASNKLSLDFI